ncbi:MAG: four helix bundle protein [Candidatus Parcubacteria bacterium]|nr:four helix bundle protein [Candidatus Parcubacteria bacterium]
MNEYQENLRKKMDDYVHLVYQFAKDFPKHELYGVVSQLRRAALSVILNYIEGYARQRPLVRLNFLEISYGSLQESKYLLHFSLREKYLDKKDYDTAIKLGQEIGAMLWKEICHLEKSKSKQLIF